MAKNKISDKVIDSPNNLETIEGIGPVYAKALNKIGVRTYADLAKYDALDALRQDLIEQAGLEIPLSKIENSKGKQGSWLKQAIEMTNWKEYVAFFVAFESKYDDKGERVWQTRTYKTENGEEVEFSGVEPVAWVNWIFEQAQLPTTFTTFPNEIEGSDITSEADVTLKTLDPVSIEITDVEVDEDPLSSILERKLIANVRFEISGPEASNLLEQQSSFLIEMWLIELDDKSCHQAAALDGQFVPNTFMYKREIRLDMPPPGRYKLRTILLLHPPNEKLVTYSEPIINIVPDLLNLEAITA